MTTITIPQKLIKDDLVIIPRKEYEKLLKSYLEQSKKQKEVILTSSQKDRLKKARKNLTQGKFLTLYDLKQKLGFTD